MKKNKKKRYQSPHKNFRLQDKVVSVALLVGAAVMLFASGANMYAQLLDSGNIAYHNNKILAVAISALSACSGLAIKALPLTFTYQQTKNLYYKALFSVTSIVIVIWLYFQSQSTTGFSINDALDPDGSKATLAFMVLLVEVLLGSSLFCGWQILHDSYRPRKQKDNPVLPVIDEEIAALQDQLTDVNQDIEVTTNAIALYESQREAFINQLLDKLKLFKARHSAIHSLFGDE
ncbi:hypothetical protein EYS14_00100 [Alteromonadaceae bacterium M269]|nr:hypothetical protein EYS14_00100 [Alteromonadaceae bacterium M269]